MDIRELRETIGGKEHEQWLRWVGTVIKDLYQISSGHNADCDCPSCKRIRRWKPNMISYSELSDEIKEYDRIEADQIIILLKQQGWHADIEQMTTTDLIKDASEVTGITDVLDTGFKKPQQQTKQQGYVKLDLSKLTVIGEEEIESITKMYWNKYVGKGLSPSEVMELHHSELFETICKAQLTHTIAEIKRQMDAH